MSGRPYEGEVAGIKLVDGRPEDGAPLTAAVVGYASRRGLTVADGQVLVPEPEADRVDARDVDIETVGTPLRDAAVDPEPGDFLAPTNAGEADPHGPEVISPEVHASQGVRPVRGGPVAQDPDAQDADELAHTLDISPPDGVLHEHPGHGTVGEAIEVPPGEEGVLSVAPAKSANKPEWVDFAVASGLDRSTAEAMTKDELIDAYGPKA